MLTPDRNTKLAVEIVVKRQLHRGFNLKEESERSKFVERIEIYEKFADIIETSKDNPENIANRIYEKLLKIDIDKFNIKNNSRA